MKKIKLLVADDHAVVRMGLVALLDAEKDIEVIGEAGDGEAAVATALQVSPTVVLMDLVMPKKDGADATAAIKAKLPNVKVLILTTFSNVDDISRAVAAGADGALLKNADYGEVVTAIRRIASGEKAIAPEITKMLSEKPTPPSLTDRQLEILDLMARGFTNADIARLLGITPDGVKFHITSILAKLDAANRSEAIGIALRKHLLKT